MKIATAWLVSLAIATIPALAQADTVSAENLSPWPLTIEQGELEGVRAGGAQAVVITADGSTYALNGVARGHASSRGWQQVDDIWKDNPDIPGTKVNVGPLIERGLKLCD